MKPRSRKDRTIVLRFASEEHYNFLLSDCARFRSFLQQSFLTTPEAFPSEFSQGFRFHGTSTSINQGLVQRRILLLANKKAYQIRPSFMMPYMTTTTSHASEIIALRQWVVPFWALARIGGKNPMFWYRIFVTMGRFSLVGTTIKDKSLLPETIVVDEKHTTWRGEKVFIATTAANGCLLGSALTLSASERELLEGYGVFKSEAQTLSLDYSPKATTTDGWDATKSAMRELFSGVTMILCYLHRWLSIKNRCRRDKELQHEIGQRVWNAYHSPNVAIFGQRLRRLREWATKSISLPTVKEKVLKLCKLRDQYKGGLEVEDAYRTSNQVDRLMDFQDRQLFGMKKLHSKSQHSTELYVRAIAMFWNFHEYAPKTRNHPFKSDSPFEKLNGFYYHENWLENFNCAASLQRTYPSHKNR
jgi:hypothetical protein